MTTRIAFLHVGPDKSLPTLMVRSVRKQHPDADIIQFSDHDTLDVAGVTDVRRLDGNAANLMTFRLAAFASLDDQAPRLYLDTDMLIVKPLDVEKILAEADVAVCQRQFDMRLAFNTHFRHMDLSEYAGKTVGEVYPYIACATITRGPAFWKACLDHLKSLPPKFHQWYGDQEAIRAVVGSQRFKVKMLPESVYANLPNRGKVAATAPRIFHFKGAALKDHMIAAAKHLAIA